MFLPKKWREKTARFPQLSYHSQRNASFTRVECHAWIFYFRTTFSALPPTCHTLSPKRGINHSRQARMMTMTNEFSQSVCTRTASRCRKLQATEPAILIKPQVYISLLLICSRPINTRYSKDTSRPWLLHASQNPGALFSCLFFAVPQARNGCKKTCQKKNKAKISNSGVVCSPKRAIIVQRETPHCVIFFVRSRSDRCCPSCVLPL